MAEGRCAGNDVWASDGGCCMNNDDADRMKKGYEV